MSIPLQEWRLEVGSTDEGERIDRFLARSLPFKSRSQLQSLLRAGRVAVFEDWSRTGTPELPQRSATLLHSGQLVIATLDAPFVESNTGAEPARLRPADVLFEDAALIALNKPSGCALHPTRRHPEGSLIERLHRHQSQLRQDNRATPCHRLDRETSGVVLFAKTNAARRAIGAMFEDHAHAQINKLYLAIVEGEPSPTNGTISAAIAHDKSSAIPIRHRVDPNGRPARTRYRVLATSSDKTRSKLELSPSTGRQHQLRVHLASLGCPILGDTLYFANDALFLRALDGALTLEDKVLLQSDRLALHATSLSFDHPLTGTKLTIEAPFPEQLQGLLN